MASQLHEYLSEVFLVLLLISGVDQDVVKVDNNKSWANWGARTKAVETRPHVGWERAEGLSKTPNTPGIRKAKLFGEPETMSDQLETIPSAPETYDRK
mmetsp:Transcript_27708/g.108667  ORF Transcript_27708/g.108667 Transcript_27708/m.108667 type:complete len:98 (-) Transcript_27708:166-459(-)